MELEGGLGIPPLRDVALVVVVELTLLLFGQVNERSLHRAALGERILARITGRGVRRMPLSSPQRAPASAAGGFGSSVPPSGWAGGLSVRTTRIGSVAATRPSSTFTTSSASKQSGPRPVSLSQRKKCAFLPYQ